ncbi:MAG: P-loop NTPase [Desulfatibacillaceae bacterium]
MSTKTTIIPVASGKGGVGKTLFAANLAIALARRGHETVAVDMDLGGSNLYTYLGVPNNTSGIGDFLKAGDTAFEDLAVNTGIDNLRFIPGDGRTPFMANISYEQRNRLIEKIRGIDARYVVLDLGAGTVFNTLNFFGLAYRGIIVTTFETPAVMNFIMFLRSFIFRVITGIVRENERALDIVVKAFSRSIRTEPLTVDSLIAMIAEVDQGLADKARRACNYYRPRIVYNMGDHPDELSVTNRIDNALRQGLSMETDHFGFVFFDDTVRMSAKNREVLVTRYPKSVAAQGISRIAARLEKTWDYADPDSARRLLASTNKEYEAWRAPRENRRRA